jgi:cell wall-associated NlpC family hydrolase
MMTLGGHSDRWAEGVSSHRSCKHLGNRRLAALLHLVAQHSFDLRLLSSVVALTTASAACASTGAVPKPFPEPGSSPPSPSRGAPNRATAPDAYALTGTALALRGSPYRDGGSDPKGFDCSGFTQYVFAQYGIRLPRDVREQYQVGKPVKLQDLAAGDLSFFSTVSSDVSHVGIALGGDEFIHAPSSTGVVRVEHLSASYWSRRFVGGRRVP